mgnify:CR=1 FL=1
MISGCEKTDRKISLFLILSTYIVLRGENMKDRDEILRIFSLHIRQILERADLDFDWLQEIRLRAERPLAVVERGREAFLTGDGDRTREPRRAWQVTAQELRETMEFVGKYSLYAYEDELKQGYLTLRGGHRVGVAGKTVLEGDKVKSVRYISCVNVRLSHEVPGCGDPVLPYLYGERGICHTLIISPPRCGKTTLLRDLVRQISDGNERHRGCTVGVVDERSEICGCYMGIPGNDVGVRTDVMDACPKAEGMMMLVRSMAPEVIAVDELGRYEDISAIETVLFSGCRLLATVHGSDLSDIQSKPLFQRLMAERVFERYVILESGSRAGQVKKILDGGGRLLC